jgi:hypothetical protein
MANDNSNNLDVSGELQPAESLQSPSSSQSNDDTGSPNEFAAPCGVIIVGNDANSSPATMLHGSDLCFDVFGKNAGKRHKHFKAFFACQDPMLPTPSRKTHPNHKVDNFLSHVNRVSMEAWDMGRSVSCDEQTIGFQGRHQDKPRISYKKEGDGFQADCICENGYTYSFYFRNVAAPRKYLRKKCSPLHARVLISYLPRIWL